MLSICLPSDPLSRNISIGGEYEYYNSKRHLQPSSCSSKDVHFSDPVVSNNGSSLNIESNSCQTSNLSPSKKARKQQQSSSTDELHCAKSSKWYEHSKTLGPTFVPGPFDVICARGKAAWNHPGNKYFRNVVQKATDAYARANSKAERTAVVSDIIDAVRAKGTGFVKQELSGSNRKAGEWIEVGDLLAREKAGQMLRNALSSKYRSSIMSKKKRRKDVNAKRKDRLHDLMKSDETINQSMTQIEKVAHDKTLSDEALMALFVQQQMNILNHVKSNEGLVEEFLQTEVTACMIFNDDSDSCSSEDSDGDTQMMLL